MTEHAADAERPKEFMLSTGPLFGEPLPDAEWLAALRAFARPIREDEQPRPSPYTHALVRRVVETLDARDTTIARLEQDLDAFRRGGG